MAHNASGFTFRGLTLVLILIAGIILSFTQLAIVSLLILIYTITQLGLIKQINASRLTKFIICTVGLFSLNGLMSLSFSLSGLNLSWELLLVIYQTIILIVLIFSLVRSRDIEIDNSPYIKKEDVPSLIIVSIALLLFVSPLTGNGSNQYRETLLVRSITAGGDNITHLWLTKINLESRSNFYGYSDEIGQRINYPQGWHYNTAFLIGLLGKFFGDIKIKQFLGIFYGVTVFWYLSLIFLFLTTASILFARLKPQNSEWLTAVVSGLVATALFAGIFLTAFLAGFQTQLAALAILLMAIIFTFLHLSSTGSYKNHYLIIASLFISATASFWFFLWPTAFVFWATSLILHWKEEKKREKIGMLSLTIAISLFFGLAQLLQGEYTSTTGQLNEPGFIVSPNYLILTGLAILAITVAIIYWKSINFRYLGILTIVAIGFSLVVLSIQLIEVGEPRYFFVKSTYTILLSASLLILGGGLIILNKLRPDLQNSINPKQFRIISGLFLISLALFSAVSTSPVRKNYLIGKPYGLSEELSDALITLAKTREGHLDKVIALGSCNRASDNVAMRFLMAINGKVNHHQNGIAAIQLSSNSKQQTFRRIKTYLKIRSDKELIIISTDHGIEQELRNYLKSDADNIQIIDLDVSRNVKSPSLCPEMLR